ncbi:MAG TPA: hypothetical protein VNS55_12705 [Nocardioides sp.]|nr:hypothetical protein [Nocardioides sp.]
MHPQQLLHHLRAALVLVVAGNLRTRDDRGDVPGWVLVTVMTAAIVSALWGIAQGQLSEMLRHALNSVK